MRHVIYAAVIAATTFLIASLGYLALAALVDHPFGGLFRMFMYHDSHPFQYIGIVAFTFGIFATVWLHTCGRTSGWKRWLSILSTIVLTILAASIPGGILWVIHDMQAGYFPEGAHFWNDIRRGAEEGLRLGWLIILLSFPYNLLGLITGGLFLHHFPSIIYRPAPRAERSQ